MDHRRHDRCEDNRTHPLLGGSIGLAALFELFVDTAQSARYELRNIDVENDDQTQQPPQISGPNDEPKRVNDGSE